MKILHAFYDIQMGIGHERAGLLLQHKTKKDALAAGEFAIFINKAWKACKILCPNGVMLYWRSPNGASLTPEIIRAMPTMLGGSRFSFGGNNEAKLIAEFEKRMKTKLASLKLA